MANLGNPILIRQVIKTARQAAPGFIYKMKKMGHDRYRVHDSQNPELRKSPAARKPKN